MSAVLGLTLLSLSSCSEVAVHRFRVEHPGGLVYRRTTTLTDLVPDGSGVEARDVVWPTEVRQYWVRLENGYWLSKIDDVGRPLLRELRTLHMTNVIHDQWAMINESGHHYDLSNTADVNGYGDTLLHRAAKERYVELACWCVEHHWDVNAAARHGPTPLHCVASMWKHGVDGDRLAVAEEGRRNELTAFLISNAADVNRRDEVFFHCCTPLHRAAQYGFTEVARMVLDRNADPNARDTTENTPICMALLGKGDWVGVAWLLSERGADLTPMDEVLKSWHSQDPRRRAIRLMLEARAEAEREGTAPSLSPPVSPALPDEVLDAAARVSAALVSRTGYASAAASVEGPALRVSVAVRPCSRGGFEQPSTPAGRAAARGVMIHVQSEKVLADRRIRFTTRTLSPSRRNAESGQTSQSVPQSSGASASASDPRGPSDGAPRCSSFGAVLASPSEPVCPVQARAGRRASQPGPAVEVFGNALVMRPGSRAVPRRVRLQSASTPSLHTAPSTAPPTWQAERHSSSRRDRRVTRRPPAPPVAS